jgi:hypothetical protein
MKLTLNFIFLLLSHFCFSQNDMTKTSFSKDNYEIQYPINWRLDTSRLMGTEFFVFSPLENETDKFSENVNVLIQNLEGHNIDLKAYKEITDNQLKNMVNDSEIYESAIIKTDNKEYYKAVYAMTQGKFRLKITSICFIKNDKAYLVTFSAELDKYDQYKKAGEEILTSFSLIK